MIKGIGTDIVEIARMQSAYDTHGDRFARKLLSENEWPAFQNSNTKARFLAKRFAAKEAFVKAVGWGVCNKLTLQDISITHDALGKPGVLISKRSQAFLEKNMISHISISDEKQYATAFAVIEIW